MQNDPALWFALAQGLGNMTLKGANPASGQMMQYAIKKKQQDQEANKTLEYLRTIGVPEKEIAAMQNNPTLINAALTSVMKSRATTGPTDAFRTAHQKLIAAGIQPGTPEYDAGIQGKDYIPEGQLNKDQIGAANALRGDLRNDLGFFKDRRNAWEGISNFYENPGAVSDYVLAVSFAKILDPGSVAREGEVAAVANSGSIPDALKASVLNALQGTGRLPENVRQEIMARSQDLYIGSATRAKQTVDSYSNTAGRYGIGLKDFYTGGDINIPERFIPSTPGQPGPASPQLPVPDGVNPELWEGMTEEQKQEFIALGNTP